MFGQKALVRILSAGGRGSFGAVLHPGLFRTPGDQEADSLQELPQSGGQAFALVPGAASGGVLIQELFGGADAVSNGEPGHGRAFLNSGRQPRAPQGDELGAAKRPGESA
jgi:hypothetical protein